MLQVNRRGAAIAFFTLLLLTAAFKMHMSSLDERPLANVAVESLPRTLGEWQGIDTVGLDIRAQETLRLSRYVKRQYRNANDDAVILYIGYWQKQSGDYQAAKHSPALCLPSNGWYIEPPEMLTLTPSNGGKDDSTFAVKRILGESKGESYLFYYWFFAGEKHYSQEWQALLNISMNNFARARADGGIIEISTRLDPAKNREDAFAEADTVVKDFVQVLYPALRALIAEGGGSASQIQARAS